VRAGFLGRPARVKRGTPASARRACSSGTPALLPRTDVEINPKDTRAKARSERTRADVTHRMRLATKLAGLPDPRSRCFRPRRLAVHASAAFSPSPSPFPFKGEGTEANFRLDTSDLLRPLSLSLATSCFALRFSRFRGRSYVASGVFRMLDRAGGPTTMRRG
jgi:hypothetical protein